MAIDFDGTDDAIDFGVGINWSGAARASISGWFNVDVFTDARGLNKSSNTSDNGQTMKLGYSTGAGSSVTCIIDTDAIASNESIGTGDWFHLAVTYDGSDVRGYLNGVEVDTIPKTDTVDTNTRQTRVGSSGHSNTVRNVDGRGRMFEIWDRALLVNEIISMCQPTYHGIVHQRLYCWPMNELASGSPSATGVLNIAEKAGGNSVAIDSAPFYVAEEFSNRRRYRAA